MSQLATKVHQDADLGAEPGRHIPSRAATVNAEMTDLTANLQQCGCVDLAGVETLPAAEGVPGGTYCRHCGNLVRPLSVIEMRALSRLMHEAAAAMDRRIAEGKPVIRPDEQQASSTMDSPQRP